MVFLRNVKAFPENSEWAYLYAVADVYNNYSSNKDNKDDDLYNPHPLKDKEVVQILTEKYNLKNIHRNTIASIREKLTTYFGFAFKTYKKGKYYVGQSDGINDNDMFLISNCIAVYTDLPKKERERLKELFSFMCHNRFTSKKNVTIETENTKSEEIRKILLINKAIKDNKKISFDYYGESSVSNQKPLKIIRTINYTYKLVLDYDWRYHKSTATTVFNLKNVRNITISK